MFKSLISNAVEFVSHARPKASVTAFALGKIPPASTSTHAYGRCKASSRHPHPRRVALNQLTGIGIRYSDRKPGSQVSISKPLEVANADVDRRACKQFVTKEPRNRIQQVLNCRRPLKSIDAVRQMGPVTSRKVFGLLARPSIAAIITSSLLEPQNDGLGSQHMIQKGSTGLELWQSVSHDERARKWLRNVKQTGLDKLSACIDCPRISCDLHR